MTVKRADSIATPEDGTAPPGVSMRTRIHAGRRLLLDRLVRRFVTFGGMAIIMAILAILFVILVEVYPLFEPPSVTRVADIAVSGISDPLAIDVEEYREIAYVVTETGVSFVSVGDGTIIQSHPLPGIDSVRATGVSAFGPDHFVLGLSDGRIVPVTVTFSISYVDDSTRRIEPELLYGDPVLAHSGRQPVTTLASVRTENGSITAVTTGPKELILITVEEEWSLFGEVRRDVYRHTLSLPIDGEVRVLALDTRGNNVFAGTSTGQIVRIELDHLSVPRIGGIVTAAGHPGAGIRVLGFLIGDRTLIVGDAAGSVGSWQVQREAGGEWRLRKIYEFTPHGRAVVAFSASRRDKGFVTVDASGEIHLSYGTTGRTLVTRRGQETGITAVSFAPRADGVLTVSGAGKLSHWRVNNTHPEITWKSLFGKIRYEDSAQPEYVWQSTGGSDESEAKFSLAPLIFGTLKGTFYSLLFAIPLAVMAALYVSQFMHPALKSTVKPVVEIMAALPSVVLGFIAGLWLAPVVERFVPALFLTPVIIPAMILFSYFAWNHAPQKLRHLLKPGAEVFLLIPVVLAGCGVAFALGALVEEGMLSGDYRGWLFQALGLTYDQRNSLVVGIAMGFAVIPIIFTIAEDSISNVPRSLVAGSLALGATRWQTAIRMVLPSASPGIFSAIMIGFGRAVGETMIVLMATGNTPVMDWSIFNGFRTLSANIAVELPEAPQGGTLYRILFLAAFLLFITTFVLNTIAELVRLRLRKKYQAM